jgi:O-antigen/teichoic acid export membrane protein
MSLKKRTINGLLWTSGQQLSSQAIAMVVQIVLARLLMPEAFGLIAMLTIFIAIGKSLVDSGMTVSLIRTQHADQRDFSTVFFMNLGMSLLLYLFIFLFAPFVSDFYKQPQLTSILRVYAITIIIQAFVAVQTTRLSIAMNFKLQMLLELPATLVGSGLGLWLAYEGYGVWALVWMYLIRSIVWASLHWAFIDWHPTLLFDKQRFKTHFNFGYKLTLSGLLDTIFTNSYSVLIGKFFNITQLGFYDRAATFRNIPLNTISSALFKVTYPMFSSIQDNDIRLKTVYKKVMQQVLFWVAPLMLFCCLVAEPAFRWVLTEKWLPAVPYFQILCIAGILFPLHVYNLNILNVKGRSDLFLRLEIFKKIIITILIIGAIPFGIYGLLYSQVISTVLSFIINSYYSGALINYPTVEQFKDILPILLLAMLSGGICWLMNHYFINENGLNDFTFIALNSLFFTFLYMAGAFIGRIPALFEFKKIILKR